MTLFPDSVKHVLGESIIGRAAAKGIIEINCVQIRDFTENKQNQVDDYPYGGGWGCVMMAQPLKACLDDIRSNTAELKTRVIYMSPQGRAFDQKIARKLKDEYDHLVLVCGHYEGIDERFIEECVDEELSLGDFVLTGGEIAAMAVTDCICRMVPGVLSDEECFTGESHWEGLLEYPQYTRPETWEGRSVPEELLSGNHARIASWRRKQSILRTMKKRPDLFEKLGFKDEKDKLLLSEILAECTGESDIPVYDCRRAVISDIDDIMDIVSQAKKYLNSLGIDQWQNQYPSPDDYMSDIEKSNCWIYTCKGETVGVITVSMASEPCYDRLVDGKWLTEGSLYGVFQRLAVREDYRNTGLASEMVAFAEELCIGTGMLSMRAATHCDNFPIQGLIKKLGYSMCGILRLCSGPDEGKTRLAFEKILI